MEIIDSHIHVGDIYHGFPIKYPLSKIPFGLMSIFEASQFKSPFKRKLKKDNNQTNLQQGKFGRFLGDIAYMESCRRIQFSDTDHIITAFDRNKVDKAIVLPIEPNVTTKNIIALSKEQPRFIPFGSVNFHSLRYMEELKENIQNGIKGLKIHPVIQRIHPENKKIYQVLEEISIYSMPVCFHVGPCRAGIVKIEEEEYAHPDQILTLVKNFPNVPFVFAHMGLEYKDYVIELAQKHKNIYLDTSFQTAKTIKKAIMSIDVDRILFGSDFPLVSQTTSIKIINKYIKDQIVKKKIFSENIKKLLGI
ncbi:amidohydrolase family protein [Desulfobacula toluolica]|uniref:Amidohydrolase 2 family protein n=1 Tax=Desulfobacula toluolica (strain DSM 7467 / Tol2) TaxID=651182 RepID=K0NLQ2_DESTT|nr:amidohydrolase family protein [Desulfobacula toluolica]CCK81680.1 amidohydrolase 2 family protein [Desulfobacula toluolica Tol2]